MTLRRVSRRRFVGVVSSAAGSVAMASLCPSTLGAAPRTAVAPRLAPYARRGPLADWTIDDMTGPYPRYAQTIGCSRGALVHSDPLDHL